MLLVIDALREAKVECMNMSLASAERSLRLTVRRLATSSKPIDIRLEEAFCNHIQALEEGDLERLGLVGIAISRLKENFRNGRALSLRTEQAEHLAGQGFDVYQQVLARLDEARIADLRSVITTS